MFDLDFDGMRRAQERQTKLANTALKGLPPEQIVPGALVTLSTNLATGDRSYVSDIYEVLAANGGTVIMKPTELCRDDFLSQRPRSVQFHEHKFYPAEALALAILEDRRRSAPATETGGEDPQGLRAKHAPDLPLIPAE
ncbi:hypothetical protein [Methylobacterium sp. Gmos1]